MSPEVARRLADLPPRWQDLYVRERPVFQIQDARGPNVHSVYSTPEGRVVMTLEPGIGNRPATEAESAYAIASYEALHGLPQSAQDAAPVEGRRAERAAEADIDAELLERMDRTIALWEEEKRDLLVKREAARAAKVGKEEGQLDAMIAEIDRRIAAHRLKKQLYTSPEWKAGRRAPSPGTTLRAADRENAP